MIPTFLAIWALLPVSFHVWANSATASEAVHYTIADETPAAETVKADADQTPAEAPAAEAEPATGAGQPLDIPADLAKTLARRFPTGVDDLRRMETQFRRIAQRAVPATVSVEVGHSIGSGVLVNAEGLVLTAAHVVGRSGRPASVVLSDGRRLPARTLGAHHPIDAGMLQLTNPPTDLPFVLVAEGDLPKPGDWVLATGQPGGVFDDRSPPVRVGRVLASQAGWLCTDCKLVGGDSGGPLFNMHGEVVAIHTSIGPAIIHNFHVPVAAIRAYWQRLLAGEVWGGNSGQRGTNPSRPLLGLAGREVDRHFVVTQVFPGLPAQEAGIQVGDRILAVERQEVGSAQDVARLLFDKRPGETLRVQLQRGEQRLEIAVVLSSVLQPLPGSAVPYKEKQPGDR